MTKIPNKDAKKLVSHYAMLNLIPVGAYGRSSHDEFYNDLDFLTFENINPINLNIDKILSHGSQYLSFIDKNGYHIDIWKTSRDTFYKDYVNRTLPKEKIIYLNKLLKKV